MSEPKNTHGGARAGAGRRPGIPNKSPSRSLIAQQKFAELVAEQIEEYFSVLHGIATNPDERPQQRIAAVTQLLDRGLGKAKEIIELTTPEDAIAPRADLVALWLSTPAAPPISSFEEPGSSDGDGLFAE